MVEAYPRRALARNRACLVSCRFKPNLHLQMQASPMEESPKKKAVKQEASRRSQVRVDVSTLAPSPLPQKA